MHIPAFLRIDKYKVPGKTGRDAEGGAGMTDCALYLNEKEIGRLRWQAEGGAVRFWASCPYEEGRIYRVTLEGAGRIYLGVMMPEGGRFVLQKKLPAHKCRQLLEGRGEAYAEVDRRRPGEEKPSDAPPPPAAPPPESEPELPPTPPLPFHFSQFQRLEGQTSGSFVEKIFQGCGGLKAAHQDAVYYAAPAEIGGELGPSAFFCLLDFLQWEEKTYCVLRVEKNGQPGRVGEL